MSRFNQNRTSKFKKTKTNEAGAQAYEATPELALVTTLLNSFVKSSFYKSDKGQLNQLLNQLDQVDPEFAAKAMVYARNEMGMRSITHFGAAALAPKASGTAWGRGFYNKVIRRPDDMTEILACYFANGNDKVSGAIKNGFAGAFNRFDEYQLAKYQGKRKSVSLKDVVSLCHPKGTGRNFKALEKLMNGNLASERTTEAIMSNAGKSKNKKAAKKEGWATLIAGKNIGQTALLRNLRNIIQEAPEQLDAALALLQDEKRIRKSLIMPFQYLIAYKTLESASIDSFAKRKTLQALSVALLRACHNVKFDGRTLVVVDNSGSMGTGWGNRGIDVGGVRLGMSEIGALMGMTIAQANNCDIMEFGTRARYINYSLDDNILKFAKDFENNNQVDHGTNFHAIFNKADKAYDRILVFSDMQGWQGGGSSVLKDSVKNYKNRTGANPFIYSFNLATTDTLQFPENKTACIAGFNTEVFNLMKAVETDKRALVNKIKAIEL